MTPEELKSECIQMLMLSENKIIMLYEKSKNLPSNDVIQTIHNYQRDLFNQAILALGFLFMIIGIVFFGIFEIYYMKETFSSGEFNSSASNIVILSAITEMIGFVLIMTYKIISKKVISDIASINHIVKYLPIRCWSGSRYF